MNFQKPLIQLTMTSYYINYRIHYDIRGVSLEWFRSYLSNRSQYVSIAGSNSSFKYLSCGVPQVSILGPLLCIIYINEFTKSSDVLSFVLFADDSNLFFSHHSLKILTDTVNSELKLVSSWFRVNKLSLNRTELFACHWRNYGGGVETLCTCTC